MKYVLVCCFDGCRLKYETNSLENLNLAKNFYCEFFPYANEIYVHTFNDDNVIVKFELLLFNED